MVEPLFFASIGEEVIEGSTFTLRGTEAKHAVAVRRISNGEKIQISDGSKALIKGEVTNSGKDHLEMLVRSKQELEQPHTKLYLVQALAKGDRDELAIQATTELGASGFIPWQAERSVSVWRDDKKNKGVSRWQQIVQEAAKQSLRGLVPTVENPLGTPDLVDRLKDFDHVLVLDPTGKISITAVDLNAGSAIALVVGPEGGVSSEELTAFESAGFKRFHLGSGVLRTSTAGVAAISYLQAKLGVWN